MPETLPDAAEHTLGSNLSGGEAVDMVLLAPEGDTHLVFRTDGTLWRGGRLIRLAPLQQRLLRCLCDRAGEVIRRDELIEAAWERREISEQSLARAIHLLRRVLNDSGLGSQSISTLYGSGYILTVPVHADPDGDYLTKGPPPQSIPPAAAVSQNPPEPPAPSLQTQAAPSSGDAQRATWPQIQRARSHRQEALHRLRRRNPAVLAAALQHLHRAEQLIPGDQTTRLALAQTLLQHGLWGLRDSADCSRAIHTLLDEASGGSDRQELWRSIEVQTLTLLDWQPQVSEERHRRVLSQVDGAGEPLAAWSLHLLANGKPLAAYQLLQPHLDSHLPWGWTTAACCLWLLNDGDGAMQALQTLMVLDPDQVTARLLLALISCHRGRANDANALLEQSARVSRASLAAICHHTLLVTALTGNGATDQARLMLKDSLSQPRQPWPSLWGLAALRLGAHVEASIWFERAVERHCPIAPFLWQSPLLQAYRGHPSLRRLAQAMDSFMAGVS